MKRTSATWPASILLAAGCFAAGCKASPQGTAGQAPAATTPSPSAAASQPATPAATAPATAGSVHKLPGGLVYEDLLVGDGKMIDPGMTAVVHCTGWLTDGTKFYSTYDGGQPLKFVLGRHEVIDGWDQGLKGMRVGGKRKLTIPPELGYGAQGRPGAIPPNATLVFEVQLLDAK